MTANVVFLSPILNGGVQVDANGVLAVNGNVHTYLAGTNTLSNTFTSNTGSANNPNPIQLSGQTGRLPNQIWISAGQNTKFVIEDQYGTVIDTQDNVLGLNDPALASGSVANANSVYTVANDAYATAFSAASYVSNVGAAYNVIQTAANNLSNTAAYLANGQIIEANAALNLINTATVNVNVSLISLISDPTINTANISFSANANALTTVSLSSAGSSGWANVTPNVMVQWGSVTVVTGIPASGTPSAVTFPIPFYTECSGVFLSMTSDGKQAVMLDLAVLTPSTTGFSWEWAAADGAGSGGGWINANTGNFTETIYWIAYGDVNPVAVWNAAAHEL